MDRIRIVLERIGLGPVCPFVSEPGTCFSEMLSAREGSSEMLLTGDCSEEVCPAELDGFCSSAREGEHR